MSYASPSGSGWPRRLSVAAIVGGLVPTWFRAVTPATVRADAVAGFTSATVVLPQAVAFAAIAGLPPQYGFYTAVVVPIVAALFGSSWVMVSGPTLVISALMFSTLSEHAVPGSPTFIAQAIALTFLVGLLQCLFGALQLGRFINFISHSVMIGFTAAAATLISVSQLKDVLGVVAARGNSIVESVDNLVRASNLLNEQAVAIAAVTLAALVLLRVLAPRLPAFIIALAIGCLVAYGLDAERAGVRMVGTLPSLVPEPSVPGLTFAYVRSLGEGAFAIALLALLEALSIGRAFAIKQNVPFDANREILAQGLSNVVGSFFQSYAGSGSFTRTGVNYEAGARTPMASIFASLFLVMLLLAIAPLFARIPIPAVAAVILYVAFRLIDFRAIGHILATSRTETLITAVTFFAGLFVNLEFAVYGGVTVSLLLFLSRTARPALAIGAPDRALPHRPFRNAELYGLPECPQAVFARLDGPLYFGSVDYLEKELLRLARERPAQKWLVLILRGVGDVDLPGAELIIAEARRRRAIGGNVMIVARFPPLLSNLERFHVIEAVGRENVVASKGEAIAKLVPRLDPSVCASCPARIFLECPAPPGHAPVPTGREAAQPTS